MELNEKKRERGANYTAEEKTFFVDLVTKYKHVIEDKRTGGIFVSKKKDAWQTIANKYNSCASSGFRSVDKLRVLYDNWKQKTRKNVAQNNKEKYAVTNEDLSRALELAKEDKIQMNKTGGGFYHPKTTDNDDKILSIIKDQIDPLPNPFDSGAAYFRDLDNQHIIENEIEIVDEKTPQEEMQEIQDKENIKPKKAKIDVHLSIRKKKNKSAESFKRIYFKSKCEVANLEKKKLMQEILQQKLQHNLKMKILNLELSKLA